MLRRYLNGILVDSLVVIMCGSTPGPLFCSTDRMIILMLSLLPGAELKPKLPSMPRLTSLFSRPCASGRAARLPG